MVKGLARFREHFKDVDASYVLIGGTACDLALTAAGLQFRATKDLDIVLCIEALDAAFARAFWDFIRQGGYEFQQSTTGATKFYRFSKPANVDFPFMLELFSRVPDALALAPGSQLTPIPVDDAVSSLSAILLDGAYYTWIHAGRREVEGVPTVGPEHLIPLKAKAWLDLRKRAASGQPIDGSDIKKHKNDAFRLYAVIDPEFRASLAPEIEADMRMFLAEAQSESVDLKAFGLGTLKMEVVLAGLRNAYDLQD